MIGLDLTSFEEKMLAKSNPHPRDDFILFEEKGHTYTFLPTGAQFTSITTLIHKYFPKFDDDKVIDKMMKSPKWPSSPYFGKTKEQIKEQWRTTGAEAAALGTQMHASIEDFFNSKLTEMPNTYEFNLFLKFWDNFKETNKSYRPFRTEWIVYDEKNKVAGTIDFVLANENGDLILLDWKRSKEIKYENSFSKGFPPIAHLQDCNFNHYCLQLNLYRHILETKYNKKVLGMFLAVFHPNYPEPQFIHIKENRTDPVNILQAFAGK